METHYLTAPPTLPKNLRVVKRRLRRLGLSDWDVARAAKVSETFVYYYFAGRRKSARLAEVIERLLAEHKGDVP